MTERWPTAEFYHHTPRSATIRETCIPVLSIFKRFFYDSSLTQDSNERQKLLTQMELVNGALVELGIVPRMHVGKTIHDFKKDPIMAAEYLAGQLLPLFADPLYSETQAAQIAQEMSLLPSDVSESPMIDLSDAPSLVTDFTRNTQVLNFISDNFVITPDNKK